MAPIFDARGTKGVNNETRRLLAGIAWVSLVGSPAWADDLGSRIATQGASAGAVACATCHGQDGGGDEGGAFPRLAGLDAGYLARQLRAFKSGGRTNPVMAPQAQALTDAEVEAVSAYYAALPAASHAMPPGEQSRALGEKLATLGDWGSRALPACGQCHAVDGLGHGDAFPALAGQVYAYLLGQLSAWAQGQRGPDPHGLMAPLAARLDLEEATSVAAYYAGLPLAPKAVPAKQPPIPSSGTSAPPPTLPRHLGPVPQGVTRGSDQPFQPPSREVVPSGPMGEAIRLGEAIFTRTFSHPSSAPYVGNTQTCAGCHLDAGRLADSAPLWAAWVAYPAFRAKDQRISTLAERVQGCFTYSMNAQASAVGHAPEADSEPLVALISYMYWLATGAPTGDQAMPGRGYPALPVPAQGFDPARGAQVFRTACALCHGADGQGVWVRGEQLFPPLWGANAYNWGAGMHRIDTAAAFIKHNMPLGRALVLRDQDAWDVAAFVNAQERPQDPRFKGDLAETTAQYHGGPFDYYGKRPGPDGRLLGEGARH